VSCTLVSIEDRNEIRQHCGAPVRNRLIIQAGQGAPTPHSQPFGPALIAMVLADPTESVADLATSPARHALNRENQAQRGGNFRRR
jgi:hypothetical protein